VVSFWFVVGVGGLVVYSFFVLGVCLFGFLFLGGCFLCMVLVGL